MDIASLILQMKSSGLRLDTAPLEAVLLGISQTLKHHDAIVSKLPKVETAQCDLRKDLNKLRLALESAKAFGSSKDDCGVVRDVANESKDCDDGGSSLEQDQNYLASENNVDKRSSYGVRKDDIEPINLKHADDLSRANDEAMERSLREVKAIIRRLQQDRDEGLVNSMELDESLKSLKENLFELQQKLSSSATVDQMQVLQQTLLAKYGQMEHHLHEFKTVFHEEVEGKINRNLSEVTSWFNGLEALVKQRQAKLEKHVASCAREYDVAAFREGIESDVASLTRKAAFLDDTARAQGRTLVVLQHKNAIAMFHRHYTNWKRDSLKLGLGRWKQAVRHQVEYEEGKKSQKRLVRKILTNIMTRRKRFGFERWIRHRDWHRKKERKKLKASSLICERIGMYLAAPKAAAFNRWRRLTLMDKMKISREADAKEEKSGSASVAASIETQRKPTLCLNSIMDSFKNDLQGATYALALEIESIKSHDIASLRRDWLAENHRLMSTVQATMGDAIRSVEDTASTFQETVNERVDSCANDLPNLQTQLRELVRQLESSRAEIKSVKKSHAERLDSLYDHGQQLEQRLSAVERRAETSSQKIALLFEEQSKSNESIHDLREIIEKNEERHEEERGIFQQALNHFGDELLKTKVNLGHTKVKCESLETELTEAKLELVHFQDACQAKNDQLQRDIDCPGLPKPSMDRIVGVGHAYETLAKEKNYVTGINVMATLRITTRIKLKRSGEKVRREEEVDIPSEIVAFAHDYAAWVAYQADHESLLRLIVGTNPEDQVYAEDDMMNRRKELCGALKSELSMLLERAVDVADRADPSSTSRGLGLRWEARAIFLARVMDATNAALSKHDQIILPASTRLGRVRPLSANVTVCVACDRPMRKKGMERNCAPTEGSEADGSGAKSGGGLLALGSIKECAEPRPKTTSTMANRPGEAFQLGGEDTSYQIPRSFSAGKVIKTSRIAESLKENSGMTANVTDELVLK